MFLIVKEAGECHCQVLKLEVWGNWVVFSARAGTLSASGESSQLDRRRLEANEYVIGGDSTMGLPQMLSARSCSTPQYTYFSPG